MTERGDTQLGTVVVLTRDVMARIRIGDLLRKLGYAARFASDSAPFVAALQSDGEWMALGVLDLNGPLEWEAIAAFVAQPARPP
ncbi:MAG TPA: hypothetical protein VFU81_13900, partial [Thermomicrobiales bacterium]|nr:hypothetical protein [Thermomicrobiales bacterium]